MSGVGGVLKGSGLKIGVGAMHDERDVVQQRIADARDALDRLAAPLRDLVVALDVLVDEFGEGLARQEGVDLRGSLDIFLPFRRGLHLLHQVDIERGLFIGDLARQPHRAGLFELRNVEATFDAGRDVVPVLRLRDLRAVRKALRVEGA